MNPSSREIAKNMGAEKAGELLRNMIRIRRFEERAAELYGETKIRGFLHLYIGEEAVAAGVIPRLKEDDAVVATYREHGHALLRGLSARAIMAEMFGKVEGCSKGRGGSMHLYDASRRFFGGNAIVGGGLPLAVGLALADKMKGKPSVTACFFGEGAIAEGEFHESMNLAALWKVPILFCCENNLYAMGTHILRSEAQTELTVKALSYGMKAESVDGMDALAVAEAAERLIRAVREEVRPQFVEFRTYRFRPHSMFDPELYRDKKEVEEWKQRDSIPALAEVMKAEGWLTDEKMSSLEEDVAREISDAVEFAEAGHWEPVEDLVKDVYARNP